MSMQQDYMNIKTRKWVMYFNCMSIYALELLISDRSEAFADATMDDAWRGAEAYHFFMLAQEQLHNGQFHDAMLTACRLEEYCGYIGETEIYTLLALTACLNGSYKICSKAFLGLKESLKASVIEKCNLLIFIYIFFNIAQRAGV